MAARGLIATGAIGAILGAICCATPLLAALFGAIGLSVWAAGADYIALAVLLVGLVLIGLGLYHRHCEATGGYRRTSNKALDMNDCCAPPSDSRAYDLVVVGAGSAGFAAAITADEQGARVALIGHGTIGG